MIKRDLEKDIIKYGNMGYDYKPFLNNGKLNHRMEHKIKHKIDHRVSKQKEREKEKQKDDENRNDGYKNGNIVTPRHTMHSKSTAKSHHHIKASLKQMPLQEKARAELVKTSSVLQKEGLEAAQKRMKLNSPEYELDLDLSTDEYIVAKSKESGGIEVAFRGTDPEAKIKSGFKAGSLEPVMWKHIMTNGDEHRFDQHNLEEILEKIQTKYDLNEIEHVSGYSMGGSKAHRLAEMLGIDSTLLNPLLGKRFFEEPKHSTNKHKIIRTTEDIATLQGLIQSFRNMFKFPKNVKIESIDPIATKSKEQNQNVFKKLKNAFISNLTDIVDLHGLEHFTKEGDRRSGIHSSQKKINKKIKEFMDNSKGKTPEEIEIMTEQLGKEMKPELEETANHLIKTKANTALMKGVTGIGLGGLGIGVGVGVDIAMQKSGIKELQNEELQSFAGGSSGMLAVNQAAKLLGQNALTTKNAFLSGGTGALAQTETAKLMRKVLPNTGLNQYQKDILSESIGGGVGGGVTGAFSMSLQAAGTAISNYTAPILATAEELAPLLGGVAEVGLAEAGAANFWNPIGWGIAGGFALGGAVQIISSHFNENENNNENNENEK